MVPYLVWAVLAALVGQEWASVKLTVLTQAVVVEAGHPVGLAVPVSVVQQNQQVIRPVAQSRIREAVVLVTAGTQVQRRMRTVRAATLRQVSSSFVTTRGLPDGRSLLHRRRRGSH